MSYETERDDLDDFKDPEVLKLIARGEREEHKKEIGTMRLEFEQRLAALEEKLTGSGVRPTRIHPNDYRKLSLNEVEKLNPDILSGRVVITDSAREGAWFTAKEKISETQLLRLPLAEFERMWARIEKNEVEVVREK